jgi:hypothetical protein
MRQLCHQPILYADFKWNSQTLRFFRISFHRRHFVFASTISAPSSPSSTSESLLLVPTFTWPSYLPRGARLYITRSPERYRPQFSPLTAPYTEGRHHGCTSNLQNPPKPIPRNGVRIERGNDEVDKMQCESKIRD